MKKSELQKLRSLIKESLSNPTFLKEELPKPYGADPTKLSDEELKQKLDMYSKASKNPNFNEHGIKLLLKYQDESKRRKSLKESKSCSCGCNSCGNKGITINENFKGNLIVSKQLKEIITKSIPLHETKLNEKLINEVTSLYSRKIINLPEEDKKLIVKENQFKKGDTVKFPRTTKDNIVQGEFVRYEEGDTSKPYGIAIVKYQGKEIRVKDSLLKENQINWPDKVLSYHGDLVFKRAGGTNERAKYEILDKETGKIYEPGGRVFTSIESLKQSAADLVKPLGGRQSSQFENITPKNSTKSHKYRYTLLKLNDKVVEFEGENPESAYNKLKKEYPNSDPMITHKDGNEINGDPGSMKPPRKLKTK